MTVPKFAVVGAIGFSVEASILSALVGLTQWGPYLPRLISFPVAVTTTWFLNRNWSFPYARQDRRARQYVRYGFVQTLGALINLAVYALLIAVGPPWFAEVLAVPLAIASLVAMTFNLVGVQKWAFAARAARSDQKKPERQVEKAGVPVSSPKLGRGPEFTILLIVYCLAAACVHRHFPTDATVYWRYWVDQGHYTESIRALTAWEFAPQHHWYPLGYALAAAPLAFLPVWMALSILDMLCLYGAWRGFRSIAVRFGIPPLWGLPLFLATTVLYPLIGQEWITPWTTTLSACLIWQGLARAFSFVESPTMRRGLLLGLVLAAIPATRPADLIVAAIVGAYVLTICTLDGRVRAIWPVAVAGVGAAISYLGLHVGIYGWRPSDYMLLSVEYGFDFRNLGWKAYLILVEPQPWFPDGQGLLRVCAWLLPGLAGLLSAVFPGQAHRREAFVLVTVALCYSILILAYGDLLPSGLWRYNLVHYFKWMLPLFALFAVVFVRRILDGAVAPVLVLGGLLLVSCVRFAPERAGPTEPARAVLLPVVEDEFYEVADWAHVYMARSVIRDRSGQLRNFFEYHQVPRQDGFVMATALRRDFAGSERWYGDGLKMATWPKDYTGIHDNSALPGEWPETPLARFKPRLEFGWPCWLPGYQCPIPPISPPPS